MDYSEEWLTCRHTPRVKKGVALFLGITLENVDGFLKILSLLDSYYCYISNRALAYRYTTLRNTKDVHRRRCGAISFF